jgi:hypothetical protein
MVRLEPVQGRGRPDEGVSFSCQGTEHNDPAVIAVTLSSATRGPRRPEVSGALVHVVSSAVPHRSELMSAKGLEFCPAGFHIV